MTDARVERATRALHAMFTQARGFPCFAPQDDTAGMMSLRASGHATAPDVHVFVHVGKLGVQPVRDLSAHIADTTHALIVYVDTITSHAREEVRRLADGVRTIETFDLSTLQFNLMDHICVPPHKAMLPREVRGLGLVSEHLPDLLRTDPVARWHNWSPGTVVRTTMANPEGHGFYEYRRVAAA